MPNSRYSGYQYETSPRKIKPEYEPQQKKKNSNKTGNNNKKQNKYGKKENNQCKYKKKKTCEFTGKSGILCSIRLCNTIGNKL